MGGAQPGELTLGNRGGIRSVGRAAVLEKQ